jgi:hypothetical protein
MAGRMLILSMQERRFTTTTMNRSPVELASQPKEEHGVTRSCLPKTSASL